MKRAAIVAGAWLFALTTLILLAATLWLGRGVSLADGILVVPLSLALVGAFIAARRPANPIGWIFAYNGWVIALETFTDLLLGQPGPRWFADEPGLTLVAWFLNWAFVPGLGAMTTFLFLLFPTGRLPSPRWQPVGWAAALAITLWAASRAFRPRSYDWAAGPRELTNPLGIEELVVVLSVIERVAVVLLAAAIVGSVASLLFRFRHSRGEERQQIKWFAFAASIAAVALPAGAILFNTPIGRILLGGAMLGLTGAVAIAILRHRLFDVDVVIRRTLTYGAVSATLVAVYIGLVIALQGVLSGFTGGSSLAVAASTLAVAALFQPVRRRVQAAVDRRFYRSSYDAARTVQAFANRLRDEVDLAHLTDELRGVVSETLRPASVSVWLRGRGVR